LQLSITHPYDDLSDYTILIKVLIKVIDILGNDTTKAVMVEIR